MARWRIMVSGTGIRRDTIDRIARAITEKYETKGDVHVSVEDATRPQSRSARFNAALSLVADAREEFEALRDELQEWYDNLPENFQSGDKGDALQAAIDELETAIQSAEEVESAQVEFPAMY